MPRLPVVSWAPAIAALTAAFWLLVGILGGGELGAVRVDVAGAAAAVGLAVVLAAVVPAVPSELLTPYAVATVVGTAATAVAGSGGTVVPVAGGVLAVGAGLGAARRFDRLVLLVVPTLVVGAEVLQPVAPAAGVAVVLAVGAAAAAGLGHRVAFAGLAALAAAAAGAGGLFWLLGAAAVVVAAVDHGAALVALLPGAVLAVDAALGAGGVALTAIATVVVVGAAAGLRPVRQPPRPGLQHVPALVVAGFLLLTSHQWAWTGVGIGETETLGRTAVGVAVAAAAGAGAVLLAWLSGQTAPPRPEPCQR